MQVTPPGVRGLPPRVEKGASQVGERQGVPGGRSRPGEAFRGKIPSRLSPSHGALVPAPCFLEPGWSWRCKQAAPRCQWLGDPWGCRAAVPASLESVKASDVHSCPRSRGPGQQDGASSRCPSPLHSSGPRGEAVERGVWAPGPPQKPRRGHSARGHMWAKGSGASIGLKVERETMLMVQGAVWGLSFYASDTLSAGPGPRAGSRLLPEPPAGNLQHPVVHPSCVSLEPGRHPNF